MHSVCWGGASDRSFFCSPSFKNKTKSVIMTASEIFLEMCRWTVLWLQELACVQDLCFLHLICSLLKRQRAVLVILCAACLHPIFLQGRDGYPAAVPSCTDMVRPPTETWPEAVVGAGVILPVAITDKAQVKVWACAGLKLSLQPVKFLKDKPYWGLSRWYQVVCMKCFTTFSILILFKAKSSRRPEKRRCSQVHKNELGNWGSQVAGHFKDGPPDDSGWQASASIFPQEQC